MALDVLRASSISIAVCSVGILIYLPEDLPRHRRSSFDCPHTKGLPGKIADEHSAGEVEDLQQEKLLVTRVNDLQQEGVQADDNESQPEGGIETNDAQEHACVGEISKTPEGHQDRHKTGYHCNAQRRSRRWHGAQSSQLRFEYRQQACKRF